MATGLNDLIAELDSARQPGYEIPFLTHGEAAFDRICQHIVLHDLPRRAVHNGLFVLFTLMESCPHRAGDLLQFLLRLAEKTNDEYMRGDAAATAIRIAMLARHPRVTVPPELLQGVDAQLSNALERGVTPIDRDYILAFLSTHQEHD